MIDNKPVIILGAGTVGKLALDIFNSNDQVIYCFLDDNKELHGTEINDVSILSDCDDRGYLKFIGNKCDAFIASDDTKYRKSIAETIIKERKVMPVNAIHNLANVSPLSSVGYGNMIGMGALINAYATIGHHNLINSGVIIDAEVTIGNFVQIGIGSNIGANVEIAEGAFIGSGVTIVQGVKIGKNARIGIGSVVIADVAKDDTVFGNPAASVKR
jgi:sugar O-acyltransferase (sialic acid O-acetyltransferase NeuD family)